MKLKKKSNINKFLNSFFSGLKVKTMKFFHVLAPAQLLRLIKTPKRFLNIKLFYTFFKTRDMIPPQLFKSLVLTMPKRVFEVNYEKMKFTLHIKVLCT